MCTLILLHRPGHPWPLLAAANRDEDPNRPWLPPARHWPDRPEVVAGLDERALGSWFGVNDYGVVAAVTNRAGSLGPDPARRTRGELVLEALDHAEAAEAAEALAALEPRAYRPFNLVVADPVSAWWLRHRGEDSAAVEVLPITPGLHMLTAHELDDPSVARIRHWLPRFREAAPPDPAAGDWSAWQALLGAGPPEDGHGPEAAMNLRLPGGVATVCSQLAAVPRHPGPEGGPRLWFAPGAPDRTAFERVL